MCRLQIYKFGTDMQNQRTITLKFITSSFSGFITECPNEFEVCQQKWALESPPAHTSISLTYDKDQKIQFLTLI